VDPKRFADLSRRFAAATTRRGAVHVLATGAAAAALALVRPESGEASQLVKGCKIPGQKCQGDSKCCGKQHCHKGRCQCIGRGGSCLVELAPDVFAPVKALCCSAKCGRGDNQCR
jgi:hypothetical protein